MKRAQALLVAAFLGGAALAHTGAIVSGDWGLHLLLGKEVAHSGPPRADHHSFTADGAPYPDHEWLAQAALYEGDRAFGDGGMVALRAFLAAAALALLALAIAPADWDSGEGLAALAALDLVLMLGLTHSEVRPHILGWVFAGALLLAIRRERWLLLPPLLAVWANLHASVLLGALVAALTLADRFRRIGARRDLALAAACAAAPLLNPYGIELYLLFFRIRGGAADFVSEWLPYPPGSGPFLLVCALLVATLAALARTPKRSALDVLLFLLLGLLALSASRNGVVAAIYLAPIVVRGLGPVAARLSAQARRALLVALALFPLTSAAARATTGDALRFRLDERALPVAATAFLDRHAIAGNVFGDYDFGGWILWREYPRSKVFVDARIEVFRGKPLDDYLHISRAREGWQPLAAADGVDFFVVREDRPISRALAADPGWALVYFDDLALIAVRADLFPTVRRLRSLSPWGTSDAATALDESRYLLAENPDFHAGWMIQARLAAATGDAATAAAAAAKYRALEPRNQAALADVDRWLQQHSH